MSYLYTYNAPIEVKDELLHVDRFYVPNTYAGVKTAAALDEMSRTEKVALFKEAEDGNLAAAFIRLQDKAEKAEAEKSEADEDEDYGQAAFMESEDSEAEDEEEGKEEDKEEDKEEGEEEDEEE